MLQAFTTWGQSSSRFSLPGLVGRESGRRGGSPVDFRLVAGTTFINSGQQGVMPRKRQWKKENRIHTGASTQLTVTRAHSCPL